MSRATVIIRHCPDYDVDRIRRLASEALSYLRLRPKGRVLIKPNVVISGDYFPHAHTRSEFIEGVALALKDHADHDVSEIAVGERSGITTPTRFAYRGAGFYPMARRAGVELYHFDEVRQVGVDLFHKGRLRDRIYTPEPVAKADFFVNCPKFKAHPWTTVTFSMKNYIGIQDDRHRLIDHDHRLGEKVADLQYVVQPQFIAIDGIIAGEGRMLTPQPFDLKLMIMGNNQVAFDAVCCRIIGVDPLSVEHIRLAHERGFGPVDMDQIDVVGDVSFEAACERGQGFEVGLIRVEDYFRGTNIHAYGGRPPADGGRDYCWGGCPGALEEAVELLRLYDKATDDKLPPLHVVFGAYDGPINAQAGEKVIFMGDCASWRGEIAGRPVQIDSTYVDRSRKDPLAAKYEDIFAKMLSVGLKLRKLKKSDVLHLTGCPVSVAEQVLTFVNLGKLKNPYFDPAQAVPFASCYLSWRTRQAMGRLMGKGYNFTGDYARGAARPPQNQPGQLRGI